MARKTDQISVTVPPNALRLIDQALETGLYGNTRAEVMRAMILDQLKKLLADGVVSNSD